MLEKIFETVRFIRSFIKNPRQVGSIAPSSVHLARAIAQTIQNLPKASVIQLGGGTGSITSHLNIEDLEVVEIDKQLSDHLKAKYKGIKITNACGIEFLKQAELQNLGILITIPLINNPQKKHLIHQIKRLYHEEKLKWVILYTYKPSSPLFEVNFQKSKRSRPIIKNLPPAYIWVYQ